MPRIAKVGHIAIYIYANDHNPPHFHAIANRDEEAIVNIVDPNVIQNTLSRTDLNSVLKWADDNRADLALKWLKFHGTL